MQESQSPLHNGDFLFFIAGLQISIGWWFQGGDGGQMAPWLWGALEHVEDEIHALMEWCRDYRDLHLLVPLREAMCLDVMAIVPDF